MILERTHTLTHAHEQLPLSWDWIDGSCSGSSVYLAEQ